MLSKYFRTKVKQQSRKMITEACEDRQSSGSYNRTKEPEPQQVRPVNNLETHSDNGFFKHCLPATPDKRQGVVLN